MLRSGPRCSLLAPLTRLCQESVPWLPLVVLKGATCNLLLRNRTYAIYCVDEQGHCGHATNQTKQNETKRNEKWKNMGMGDGGWTRKRVQPVS